jgi:hypothetical protein
MKIVSSELLAEMTQRLVAEFQPKQVTKETTTVFGRYYRVDWTIPSQADVELRTIWEIAAGEEIPRLISAFIL